MTTPSDRSQTPSQRGTLSSLADYFVELAMCVLPQDAHGMRLKAALLRWRGVQLGQRTKIWRDVWIDDYQKLSLGDDITIGRSVMMVCVGGVTIGDRVMVGHGAKIISAGHVIPDSREQPMRWSGADQAPIHIADDAWIGAGAIILPGVGIGNGAVVAAGSVVTKSVPDYVVVAGVPTKIIRERA